MCSSGSAVDCSSICGTCRIHISIEYLFKYIIIASPKVDLGNFSSLNIHLDSCIATSRREEAKVSLEFSPSHGTMTATIKFIERSKSF